MSRSFNYNEHRLVNAAEKGLVKTVHYLCGLIINFEVTDISPDAVEKALIRAAEVAIDNAKNKKDNENQFKIVEELATLKWNVKPSQDAVDKALTILKNGKLWEPGLNILNYQSRYPNTRHVRPSPKLVDLFYWEMVWDSCRMDVAGDRWELANNKYSETITLIKHPNPPPLLKSL